MLDMFVAHGEAPLQPGADNLLQAMLGHDVASTLLVIRSAGDARSESSGNSKEGMDIGASHFLRHEAAVTMQTEGMAISCLGGARSHEEGLRSFRGDFGPTRIDTESVSAYVGSTWQRRMPSAMQRVHRSMSAGNWR